MHSTFTRSLCVWVCYCSAFSEGEHAYVQRETLDIGIAKCEAKYRYMMHLECTQALFIKQTVFNGIMSSIKRQTRKRNLWTRLRVLWLCLLYVLLGACAYACTTDATALLHNQKLDTCFDLPEIRIDSCNCSVFHLTVVF